MSGVVFARWGVTNLYRPIEADHGGVILFLLWPREGVEPPALSTLADTWEPLGASTESGYYLFCTAEPSNPASFQAALLQLLPGLPAQSSFAWVKLAGDDEPTVLWLMPVAVVDGEAQVTKRVIFLGPPGSLGLVVHEGTPVCSMPADGTDLDGFALRYPPVPASGGQPAAEAPYGIGMSVPMRGNGAGAFQFQGLRAASGTSDGCALQVLFDVHMDPLRPFDGHRTYNVPTGQVFELCGDAQQGFSIRPVVRP
jgi:hypothetical protein